MSIMDDGSIFGGGGSIFGGNFLPAIAIAFSSGLKAVGSVQTGNAMVTSAQRRQQAAHFEAEQMRVNAGQAIAESHRTAHFEGQKATLLASAARARMGSGASDPTSINILAEIMSRRAYNMQAALYSGQDKARVMRMQATAKEHDAALAVEDAKAGRRGQYLAAAGSLASGAASLYEKYWAKDMTPSASGGGGFGDADMVADEDYGYYADAGRRRNGADTYGIRG